MLMKFLWESKKDRMKESFYSFINQIMVDYKNDLHSFPWSKIDRLNNDFYPFHQWNNDRLQKNY